MALALTLAWARPVMLVEADVSKPSAVVAGLLQGALPADAGLMGVAQTAGIEAVTEQDIWDFSVPLPQQSDEELGRWLLPALSEPAAARQMRSFWTDLLRVLRGLDAHPMDAIVDLGRIEERHGRHDLILDTDHLALVVRSDLASVAALGAYLPEIEADYRAVKQVLLNLLSNAIKFTPRGGRITVIAEGRRDPLGEHVRVSVQDTGIGIAPDVQQRLFQRFTQADASVSRTYGGTGLGLAISRQLVELMGGSIGVEGRLSGGSTFWFEVPLPVTQEAPPAHEEIEEGLPLSVRRVLVVDDSAANRDLLAADAEIGLDEAADLLPGMDTASPAGMTMMSEKIATRSNFGIPK